MMDSKILKVIKYVLNTSCFMLEHVIENNGIVTTLVFKDSKEQMLFLEVNKYTVKIKCRINDDSFNLFYEQEINEELSRID